MNWVCKRDLHWGNSSVVERWIPDPAVGGSIPSSLNFSLSHYIGTIQGALVECYPTIAMCRGDYGWAEMTANEKES